MQEPLPLRHLADQLQPLAPLYQRFQIHLSVVFQNLKLLLVRTAVVEKRALLRPHQFGALNGAFQNR